MSGLAEVAVQVALLDLLRGDAEVQALFGSPARVFDADSEAPAYPFARLERHECVADGASETVAHAHRISIAVISRDGGLAAANAALGTVRRVIEAAEWSVPGHHVVMAHVIYADVMRQADQRAYRGLIRVRIISEEMN